MCPAARLRSRSHGSRPHAARDYMRLAIACGSHSHAARGLPRPAIAPPPKPEDNLFITTSAGSGMLSRERTRSSSRSAALGQRHRVRPAQVCQLADVSASALGPSTRRGRRASRAGRQSQAGQARQGSTSADACKEGAVLLTDAASDRSRGRWAVRRQLLVTHKVSACAVLEHSKRVLSSALVAEEKEASTRRHSERRRAGRTARMGWIE